ncbi:hypothetical protein [Arhodomonas sp. SL1]|uniref:hypothetical protein n=1 Tax=Arhodomonas sp. SL1 TaxID=3425691 RepID=UPI003F881B33
MAGILEKVTRGEHARLVPVVADTSREERAVSVVLAGFRGVEAFREAALRSIGQRVGKRSRFTALTEVVFEDDSHPRKKGKRGSNDRPDGLLVLDTSRKEWSALVEGKIGSETVDEDQLKRYVAHAKARGVDAVITITNQFVARPDHHPVKLSKRDAKGIELYHWSWMYLLTEATLLLEEEAVGSADQRFVLEEIVRYLHHDSSGVSGFRSMNPEWKEVVSKVRDRVSLSKSAEEVRNTVSAWHQEQRDLGLILSRKVGRSVRLKLPREHRKNPDKRLEDDAEALVREHRLTCTFDVPDAASDIEVAADLARRSIFATMRLEAPRDKKTTKARVNWLVRQLKGTEMEGIQVRALRRGRGQQLQASFAELDKDPRHLEDPEGNSPPSAFEIFYSLDLAGKFTGNRVFIERLEAAIPHFYEHVGQRLRAWVPPPPQIQSRDATESDGEFSSAEEAGE